MATGYPDTMSNVAAEIFGAYDIRGVVPDDLTADLAVLVGKACGTTVLRRGWSRALIGRDGRLSGPELSSALSDRVRATGCNVVDVGLGPTPTFYFGKHPARPSNNGPIIVLRFEAESLERLDEIQQLYNERRGRIESEFDVSAGS